MADWTFLFHWSGLSTGLQAAEQKLLTSLRTVGSGGRIHVVYELRGSETTQRGHLSGPDGSVERFPPSATGDATESIRDFVEWAAKSYPSEHTALFVKGHSGGLDRPTPPPGPAYVGARDVRVGLERSTLRRVDVCGLDSCDMSLVELACELRSVASFLVATQSAEPTDAFPYASAIAEIQARSVAPRELAKLLAVKNKGAFLAATDLGVVGDLKSPMDLVGDKLSGLLQKDRPAVERMRGKLTSFGLENQYVDLRQLLIAVDRLFPGDDDVRSARVLLERASLASTPMHLSRGLPSSGLSVFFPSEPGSAFLPTYDALDFASGSRWTKFLKQLYS